jgi:hypothetical protein
MQMRGWIATWAGGLLAFMGTGSAYGVSFDGKWSVLQICETTTEGARGYTWRYNADVKDGRLVGQYHTKGQIPWMTLEGQIQPDGTATLRASGVSGDAEHNIKFAPAQTPISFQVAAKFEGTKGSGKRLGVRACAFTFSKQ